jgi:hypothetical protein
MICLNVHLNRRLPGAIMLVIAVLGTLLTQAQCGLCEHPVQLISNGNFTAGNTGFSSELTPGSGFFCPLCPEGTYMVGTNAVLYHTDFTGTDHTNPPTGRFFIANATGEAGVQVWCQNVTVEPYTDYQFTFWGRDITNNSNPHPTAWLHASFNGIQVGDSLNCEGGWQSFTTNWNSGPVTALSICIVNTQWQTGGNDFGLDDITLTACHTYTLSQTADLGPDLSACGGHLLENIGMPSLPGYQYQWTGSTGLSSTTTSDPDYLMANAGPGVFTDTLVIALDSASVGCITRDTLIISVLPLAAFDLGPDVHLCEGGSLELDAGNGWDSVLWSDGSQTQQAEFDEAGVISATVSQGSCNASDEINLIITDLPDLNLPETAGFCEGGSVSFDAGVSGVWSDGTTGPVLLAESSGTYTFVHEQNGCTVSAPVVVTEYAYPDIVITAPDTLCEGTSAEIVSNLAGLWNTGVYGTTITLTSGGSYDLSVTVDGCTSSAGVNVEEIPLPKINLPADTAICDQLPLVLNAYSEQTENYVWSDGHTTPAITIHQPGIYSVEASNSCGTADAAIEVYTYPCEWDIYVPSAVTPDNDGINDDWVATGWNISQVEISVYNRLGDRIHFTNRFEPWQPGPGVGDDVFNYYVSGLDYLGKPFHRQGTVTVLR